jgi:hypothetical protein
MSTFHVAVFQDPHTYGNCIPRVDVAQSDPKLKEVLDRKGIDMETFEAIPNQVEFVTELMNPKTPTAPRSVKNDLARLLSVGGIRVVDLESKTLAVHAQLMISQDGEDWEPKSHVHRGVTQYTGTRQDGIWYSDGIVITRHDPNTMLVNTFSYWEGYTCVERIFEIETTTWTITKAAYNGFGNGLALIKDDAASMFEETVTSFTQTAFPYTFKLHPGHGIGTLYTIDTDERGLCMFVGDDGSRHAYDDLC